MNLQPGCSGIPPSLSSLTDSLAGRPPPICYSGVGGVRIQDQPPPSGFDHLGRTVRLRIIQRTDRELRLERRYRDASTSSFPPPNLTGGRNDLRWYRLV